MLDYYSLLVVYAHHLAFAIVLGFCLFSLVFGRCRSQSSSYVCGTFCIRDVAQTVLLHNLATEVYHGVSVAFQIQKVSDPIRQEREVLYNTRYR